ncbi:MAG: EAL domain-containing protein [Gammaproteobacteria bacterium]|nr:EAL domain-containing protein [Gammaproteobacteria bacterium]
MLCAMAPLLVAALFLVREFDQTMQRAQQQDLEQDLRVFGMTVFNRLSSADDAFYGLVQQAPAAGPLLASVTKLPWVASARAVGSPAQSRQAGLPVLSAAQQLALEQGKPALAWEAGGHARRPYIVRRLADAEDLWIGISRKWLYADIDAYLDDTALEISAGDAGTVWSFPVALARGPTHHADWELFVSTRFAGVPWHFSASRAATSTLAMMRSAQLLFPFIVALTLLTVSLLAVAMIRRRLAPLQQLVAGTQRIARRDFGTPITVRSDDEIGSLAQSFNAMSSDLRRQFTALETLSEVDRLMLQSPAIEVVLDALLPKVAAILACDAVSVVLADTDSDEHARVYDFNRGQAALAPVRRVVTDLGRLATASDRGEHSSTRLLRSGGDRLLAPLHEAGAQYFSMHALRTAQRLSGVLLLGYHEPPGSGVAPAVRPEEFAARLAVALDRIEQAARLHQQAHFDALTGLANRRLFMDRLRQELEARPGMAAPGAVLYIDIDHFKRINDTEGHGVGDTLLCTLAERLKTAVGAHGVAARLGGDEFAVLLPAIDNVEAVRQLAQQLLKAVAEPMGLGGRSRHVGASIGIALYPNDANDIEGLMMSSDVAMYRAKELGRAQAVFFEAQMQRRLEEVAAIETGLHRALHDQELVVAYQPIYSAGGRRLRGVEALARWPSSPGEAPRSPAEFIPVAEESGLIVELGHWVLNTACRQFMAWRRDGLALDYVSVNVSVRQLMDGALIDTVRDCLARHGLQPGELQLEITESVLAEASVTGAAIEALASLGVRLALDDFGTGYSSLNYLRSYPIHTIKIDRAFVRDLPHNVAACRLVEAMLAMAKAVQREVVAEGVETPAQMEFLDAAGCGGLQGFLLGRPMEAQDLLSFARGTTARLRALHSVAAG